LQDKRKDIVNQEKPLDRVDKTQFIAPYMDLIKPV